MASSYHSLLWYQSGLSGGVMLGSCTSTFAGLSLAAAPQTQRASRGQLVVTAGVIGPGKRWEKLPVNSNGKVLRKKLHVRKGDTVQVIAGADKGKVGEIVQVFPKTGKVVVEGVNMVTKHMKPRAQGETGSIEKREGPIDSSNVMHYSKEQKVRSRVGMKFTDDGKKVRYLKKTGEVLQ